MSNTALRCLYCVRGRLGLGRVDMKCQSDPWTQSQGTPPLDPRVNYNLIKTSPVFSNMWRRNKYTIKLLSSDRISDPWRRGEGLKNTNHRIQLSFPLTLLNFRLLKGRGAQTLRDGFCIFYPTLNIKHSYRIHIEDLRLRLIPKI